jgi:cytochrome c biogenesis protein CcmG/thiol:disulfide interchange protein DsbE
MWREYRAQGLIMLGVDTQDLEASARAYIREFGITYPNVRDPDGSVARLFGTTGGPETFFIGRDGRVRGHFAGAVVRRAAWQEAAAALLGGRARVP